jgi:glycosyltransferase involved in cell wall biosynthesis
MNLLMVNATWYPSGGDWTYIESICKIYEHNGFNIIPFAMKHERNFDTPYSQYFVENIDFKELNKHKSLKNGLKVLTKSIFSIEAQQKLELLLSENKVDIVQLNNIHNVLTPSIIPIIKKRKIPIVWRVLDYKLICPNRTFLSNDTICESCFKTKYYNCTLKKCKKQSVLASMVASLESYAYSLLPYYNQVDQYLFQSEFTRDQFIKYGFDPAKAIIIENPYDAVSVTPNYSGNNYILYFGRISSEKGMSTLYEAMRLIPDIKLKIIGDGTALEEGINYVKNLGISNIEFLGSMWGKELEVVLSACDFVVLPSEWYDPSPYVVLQAYSFGKPVIATRIGGLQDMIIHDKTGKLVEIKNPKDLSLSISSLFNDKQSISEFGKNARTLLLEKYSTKRYFDFTKSIFDKLISSYI